MARKQKASPYDDSAGRGTGDYLAQKPSTAPTPVRTSARAKGTQPHGSPPDSSLFGAILATIFCFWPLGLVAIIWALRVRPRWKRGDEAGARHAAAMAEKLTFAAVGVFVILFFATAIIYGVTWFIASKTKP